MNNTYLILLIVAASTVISCKKDKNKVDTIAQLTTGKWKLIELTWQQFTNGVPNAAEDRFYKRKECKNDDLLQFLTNGAMAVHLGTLICTDTTNQSTNIAWKVQGSDTIEITTINNGGFPYESTTQWQIDYISKEKLKLKNSHDGGTTYRFETIETYKFIE